MSYSYYTAKFLREVLADVPDDEPVAGIVMLRGDNQTPGTVPSEITPEEWVKIVDKWENDVEDGFTGLREALIDVISEVCSEPELFWSEDADTEGHWHNAEGQDVDEKGNLL